MALLFGKLFSIICLIGNIVYCIQINTKLGDIEGITTDSVSKFLNIPYAEPPINELRWRPPQPLNKAWEGVYNATQFGNMCIQPKPFHAFNVERDEEAIYDEDCLYLNVYTPLTFASECNELRAVLFWIHGGGLEGGTSMVKTYDATNLVKHQDIVVVTINYRLGRAGFLVDPLLYNSRNGNGGSNGFLDMIQALKWTKNNIESFGGNGNDITIAGESGGGWAVCGLVVSPLAKGLFKRSIQMSGSCIKSVGNLWSKDEAYKNGLKLRRSIGVKTFNELRTVSMQQIADSAQIIGYPNLPSIDGYVFPVNTLKLLSNGHVNGESSMIGTMFVESLSMNPFFMGKLAENEEELKDIYYQYFYDSQVIEFDKYYPLNDDDRDKIWKYKSVFNSSVTIAQITEQTDCWVRCGSLAQTEIISSNPLTKNSFPVYFYQIGYISEPWDQVTHAFDIGMLFGRDGVFSPFWSNEFSEIIMRFFGDYIKGINPMINDKKATVQNGYYLQIVDGVKVKDLDELDVVKKRCELWDKLGNVYRDNSAFCLGIGT